MSQQTNQQLLLLSFGLDPPHVHTITQIRQAWAMLPPLSLQEQVDDDAKLRATFEQVRTSNQSPSEWLVDTILNPDKRTPNTPWRELAYWHVNPIFVSALKSLLDPVGPDVSVNRDTSHLSLPVRYPKGTEQPLQFTFHTDVFLVLAFLESDTKIRIETVHPLQSQNHTFDLQMNPYEVVRVRGGVPVEFFVEGGKPKTEDDLAGVFALGIFLNSEGGDDWSP